MSVRKGAAAFALSCAAANLSWGYQPAVNYQLHCMGCHLADGSGQPGRVPSIRRTLVLFSQSAEGRDYVVRVPGVAQSPLSGAETATLLNWMARNLSDVKLPPGFTDYSAAEIQSLRGHPLVTVKQLRARLLRTSLAPPTAPPRAP
ncbi:MAG: cytochrome c [Gammaproteobacteria bacterium]